MIGFDMNIKVYYTPKGKNSFQKILAKVNNDLAASVSETQKNAKILNF